MFDDLSSKALLESLTSGAIITDRQGKVFYANPMFFSLAKLSENDVAERHLKSLFKLPPKTDCALCLGLSTQSENAWANAHSAFLTTQPDNDQPSEHPEALRVKIKHSPLPDGNVLCLIDPFSEDATLTQAHSDFVSTVSHEFRTPLTSIKGFADTLLQYGAQLPDEEKRRFISIIKDQADQSIGLVENLLAVSKLGAGRLEMSYRPIPLQRTIDKVTHSIQAKHQSKNPNQLRQLQVLVNPAGLEVWADADRFEQILINLVDNAIKYSANDSIVSIKGELLPEDDSLIRISVEDKGVGIPEELLPKIFTKFYRAETPLKQEVEGTGLGLYITQSLTQAMGGQLSAESIPGQGSTFTVVFPAATPERQAAHRRKLSAAEEA